MCTATLGATPVYRCTCAASSIFSCGVRGVPGLANTLKRVPVFPNAQDGSSIRCASRAFFTALRSGISRHLRQQLSSGSGPVLSARGGTGQGARRPRSVQVEDLVDPPEPLVRPGPAEILEVGGHLRLPALVDGGARHPLLRRGEVVGLQVADEEPLAGQEQRVVAPARRPQSVPHLRPDGLVPGPVLAEPAGPYPGQEAHSLHLGPLVGARGSRWGLAARGQAPPLTGQK